MRKNKLFGKSLALYSEYYLYGRNAEYFVNACKRRGLTLYNVKAIDEKTSRISVKYTERKKFFAITEELCYNDKVKKIKDGGALYPLLFFRNNFGLVLGTVLLILTAVFFNDLIFKFEFTGSGSVLKSDIREFLYGKGITEYSRFSDIDLTSLEDKILAYNDELSFVSCTKKGNTLSVRAELSTEKRTPVVVQKDLFCDCDGVIDQIKVYRGTALKNVGDRVKTGELLVSGKVSIKEQELEVGVIAYVSVITEKTFVYCSEKDGEENRAELFALQNLEQEPIYVETQKKFNNGKFEYTTLVKIKRVLYAG